MARKQKPVIWNDKGGNIIDAPRLRKHEKSIRGMIRKYFPANACYEASMSKFDLRAECRLEVAKALVNFDPILAIEGLTKFSERKTKSDEAHLEEKRSNVEKTLADAEERWIRKRLHNYLLRLRWKNSPDEKGGRAISIQAVLAKANTALNEDGSAHSLFGVDSDESPNFQPGENLFGVEEAGFTGTCTNVDQAESDRDELMDLLQTQGHAIFKTRMLEIEGSDPVRFDNLMAFLDARIKSERQVYTIGEVDEAKSETDAEDRKAAASDDDEEDSF